MKNISIFFLIISSSVIGSEGSLNGGSTREIKEVLSYKGRPNFRVHIPKIKTPVGKIDVIELCKDGSKFRNITYDDRLPLFYDSTAELNIELKNLGKKKECAFRNIGSRGDGPRCESYEWNDIPDSKEFKLYAEKKKSIFRQIFSKRTSVAKAKFTIPKCK